MNIEVDKLYKYNGSNKSTFLRGYLPGTVFKCIRKYNNKLGAEISLRGQDEKTWTVLEKTVSDYLTPVEKRNVDVPVLKEDKVNHPSHYTWLKDLCGIEVIDITRHMDFDLGNAIKYILRCGHKAEIGYTNKEKTIEDLKKAIFYINDKINHIK